MRSWPQNWSLKIVRIALLTKYGNLAASTRQRFQQYIPYLADNGFEVENCPLLDDAYLEKLYQGAKPGWIHVVSRYVDRLLWLMSRPKVDLIWLHCELFPFLPGIFERLVVLPGKPVVFDYDDAIFHNYDQHPRKLVRLIMGNKLQTTIAAAKLATCGNEYLAAYAHPLCSRVEVVPTVVDTTVYFPCLGAHSHQEDMVRIGWIGTPSTWKEYMLGLMPALSEMFTEVNATLFVMGAGSNHTKQHRVNFVNWSEPGEASFLQGLDIGIMPLTDTAWARGKCGYKLIQYMACGLPVVASPVGVNAQIVEHGVNGFLASTDAEWHSALKVLISNPDLRRRMGEAGRRKIEQHYSLKVWGPRVSKLLRDVSNS